jgi:hypothetical protein
VRGEEGEGEVWGRGRGAIAVRQSTSSGIDCTPSHIMALKTCTACWHTPWVAELWWLSTADLWSVKGRKKFALHPQQHIQQTCTCQPWIHLAPFDGNAPGQPQAKQQPQKQAHVAVPMPAGHDDPHQPGTKPFLSSQSAIPVTGALHGMNGRQDEAEQREAGGDSERTPLTKGYSGSS